MNFINKIFTQIERILSRPKINIVKTIYFNFRTMPFKVAVKLPIYLYGKVQIGSLSGRVLFQNCEVKRGMVTLGRCVDMFYPKGNSLIVIGEGGKLVFEGTCFFNTRYTIRITRQAKLVLGNNVRIGSNVRICCQQSICIGANTGITYNCEIMDSNFHYMINKTDNSIHRYTSPISIGASNWIGNNSQIMKGSKTKDYTIVAARSLLNRDYATMYPKEEYATLAGIPAKLKSTNFQRIFSFADENRINKYYREHPNDDIVHLNTLI